MNVKLLFLVPVLLLGTGVCVADTLVGKDRFLCSAVEAVLCTADGVCDAGPPWDWQIPQFVIVDLAKKQLATTEASGENRTTPILGQFRESGQIVVQGVQSGRAFSMILREDNGHATIAIATEGLTINVFGACTPTSGR